MTDVLLTADLCDAHDSLVQVAKPIFRDYGGRSKFSGPVKTVRLFEDNTLLRQALETPGDNRVLVVDGGGSDRCALFGGLLAEMAQNNGWAGLVINGYVRDSLEISEFDIGVRALGTCPRKSEKRGKGNEDVTLFFADVEIHKTDYIYADEDGLLVASKNLVNTAD